MDIGFKPMISQIPVGCYNQCDTEGILVIYSLLRRFICDTRPDQRCIMYLIIYILRLTH